MTESLGRRMLCCSCFVAAMLAVGGCSPNCRDSFPAQTRIQVNVPDEAVGPSGTKLIALDVQEGRDAFADLYVTTKRVGRCNPDRVRADTSAREAITVSYWRPAGGEDRTFTILSGSDGRWITTGYGDIEVFDHPEGWSRYRYTDAALAKVRAWYEQHVPRTDATP
ncbi:MAG: hypothetical protein JXB13_19210 [Phycisphaerae bacterium]|nr:hypothetical protein [Phycisphaerae bacterium]